ncbi:MAG: EboA family metabolite traffic protein [Cyanobacteria bacterium J06621_11]
MDILKVKKLLHDWLVRQVPSDKLSWLDSKLEQLSQDCSERLLFIAFSSVPRYTGKVDLQLTNADLEAVEVARAGWMPQQWSLDQVGRALLLLSLPTEDGERYRDLLEKLFSAADVNEQIALYQSLPLLPHPELFVSRAAEGLRTNISAVFDAIALNNPFPGDYFDEPKWNQMILKAVFVGSPLHKVQQLDRKANAELARMLSDYAHERWAAKREVTPELWRLVGPCLNEQLLADLKIVMETADKKQQVAAAIACIQSPFPSAQTLLSEYSDVRDEVSANQLDWEKFSQTYLAA